MLSHYQSLSLPFPATSLAVEPYLDAIAYENQSLAEVNVIWSRESRRDQDIALPKSAPSFRRNALSWHHRYLVVLEASGKRLTFWDAADMQEMFHYETSPQIIRHFCVDESHRQVLLVLSPSAGQVFESSFPNVILYTFGESAPAIWFEPDVTIMTAAFSAHGAKRFHLLGHRPKGSKHRELLHYSGSSLSDLTLSVIDTISNERVPGVTQFAVCVQPGDAPICDVVFYGESLHGSMLYQYQDGFWIHDQTLNNERVLGLAPFAGRIVGLLETLDDQEGFLIRDMLLSRNIYHSHHGLPSCFSVTESSLAVVVDSEIQWFRGEV